MGFRTKRNCFNNNNIFFSFATHFMSSSFTACGELRHQFVACSGCRDDNGKFGLERVNVNSMMPGKAGLNILRTFKYVFTTCPSDNYLFNEN